MRCRRGQRNYLPALWSFRNKPWYDCSNNYPKDADYCDGSHLGCHHKITWAELTRPRKLSSRTANNGGCRVLWIMWFWASGNRNAATDLQPVLRTVAPGCAVCTVRTYLRPFALVCAFARCTAGTACTEAPCATPRCAKRCGSTEQSQSCIRLRMII